EKFVVVAAVETLGINEIIELSATVNPLAMALRKVKIPDIFVFKDMEMTLSPKGGNIGSVEFDPGLQLKGAMDIMGEEFIKGQIVIYPENVVVDYAFYVKSWAKMIHIG